ncbi:ATP-dependent peptidase [Amanita rubescens]|nr:ATP-dependent peptidase [Amanita rubescens]
MLRRAVLSTRPALRFSPRLFCVEQPLRQFPILSPQFHTRNFSLASIFPRFSQKHIPSPHVVAQITRLEADANVSLHDVDKQLALFRALIDTRMPSSYELVVSRWDRMCEYDPASPLLHSADAFQLYLGCLVNLGQDDAVNAAVEKRDSLIAAHPLPEAPSPQEDASVPQTEQPTSQEPQQTQSQILAQTVLARSGAPPSTGTMSQTDLSKLLAALSGENGTPIQVSVIERKGAWIPRTVRFVCYLFAGSFFFLVVLSVFFENTGFMKAGPRQSQFQPTDGKAIMFSDVHGVDEVKEELQDIVQFLKDPAAFASLGGKLPKGVLLTGPPGTGKTMLARAVAGEAGVPFFFASGSDFEEMFVGVGAKRVRDLFAAARKKEPAIIFIDELDAVGGKRSNRDQQYMKQTLNQLLVELDGFQQSEGVIIIGATNFPESLDQALVRPGRFDRIISVPLPDIKGRVQILQHHMRNVVTSKDVDPKVLARGTPGFSGADLQNMVNLAAIQASKEKATDVDLKHFEWAKDRILMGAERKSQFIDPKNKLATAYHEGGHALVALYTDGAMPLHKVTCVPRGHALGYTSQLPENDRTSVSYKEYTAEVDVCMGGRVAEQLIYGAENVTSGASSDIRHATRVARNMVKNWGFSKLGPVHYGDRDDALSPHTREAIEREVLKIIRDGEGRVTTLLTSKIDELHRLAHALVEHETLDSTEVQKVIKGEPIRHISEVLDEELQRQQDA